MFFKMKVARAVKADSSLVSCTRYEAWQQGFCDNPNGDSLWGDPALGECLFCSPAARAIHLLFQ
jgi:hypothetical protein